MSATEQPLVISSRGNLNRGDTEIMPSHIKPCAYPTPQRECCMCGDVGIKQKLFRCTRCRFRIQHLYCSNSYPINSIPSFCNWCDGDGGFSRMEKPTNSSCRRASNGETPWPQQETWKDEIEMLLEAASLAMDDHHHSQHSPNSSDSPAIKESKIKATCSKKPRLKMERREAYHSKREDPSSSCVRQTRVNSKFKYAKTKAETSAPSRRIGRRYKCIVDVY